MYVSNESDEPVYFDNLQVTQAHGRIIEEDHYYAYGLKIAAISSKKLSDVSEGHIDNKDLYNDKELIDDGDLNWYDYGFRNYDAQIGRFTQLDPLTFSYPYYTPFQYAGCEPISNVDLDSLEPLGAIGAATNTAAGFGKVAGNFSEILAITSIGIHLGQFALNLKNSTSNQIGGVDFPGATTEFKTQYKEAKKYLDKHKAGGILKSAETQKKAVIHIKQTKDPISKFDLETNTVFWNPTSGTWYENPDSKGDDDGQVSMSPAAILSHELDHAVSKVTNPKAFDKRSNIPDNNYEDAEEARVVKGSEQKVAKATGELGGARQTRKNHSGHTYETSGPATTESLYEKMHPYKSTN